MISIINDFNRKYTVIKKIKSNLWEFDGRSLSGKGNFSDNDSMDLKVPNSTIDKKGLKDYIKILKEFMEEKYEKKNHKLKWVNNPAEIFLVLRYDKISIKNPYIVTFYAKNKHLVHYTASRDGRITAETFSGIAIDTTEQKLKKYIEDLENEIED